MMERNLVIPRSAWLSLSISVFTASAVGGCSSDSDDEIVNEISVSEQCASFEGRTFGEATVTETSLVPVQEGIPEHCVVLGEMETDLDFRIWMPSNWNERTVFVGGGGFDGVIADPTFYPAVSPDILGRGYAVIASNHGHYGPQDYGGWALDEGMLLDYANRSVPRVMAPAESILTERYGERYSITKKVYEGCSGGGRQALLQAQRHPNLFDGVISRAPANAYNAQFLWYQKVFKQLEKPGAALTVEQISALSDTVYEKCDGLDGLKDRVIGLPNSCDFDPSELACSFNETENCLTPTQVETAETFYAPTNIADGRYTWAGFPPGGEEGTAWGPSWGSETARNLMEGYIRYMVAQDAGADSLTLDPVDHTPRIDQLVEMIDATDSDLSEFQAAGGKLILWTGLADWLITANNATEYYESVLARMGGQDATADFIEYYTSPGVAHCAGGNGADKIDFIEPMFKWLEEGVEPSSDVITAGRWFPVESDPIVSRPVCHYPQYPRYIEGSDPALSSSFECTMPQ